MQHLGPASVTVRPGVSLVYELLGDAAGQGIVVMHGGQSGRHESRRFALALAAAAEAAGVPVRILIHDRRNMGASSVAFGDASERGLPEEEAEDLHLLLQSLRLGPCVCMGSSSGARTSLLLALAHPADVAGLVLAPPTGGGATSPVSIENLARNY